MRATCSLWCFIITLQYAYCKRPSVLHRRPASRPQFWQTLPLLAATRIRGPVICSKND
jgi:hypothetical protein